MMPPYGLVPTQVDPRWVDGLKRQKQVNEALCSALRDYLCLGIEAQLASLDNPQPAYTPHPEALIYASQERDLQQKKVDLMRQLIDSDGPGAEMVEAVMLPDAEASLERAEQYLSSLQAQMEATK